MQSKPPPEQQHDQEESATAVEAGAQSSSSSTVPTSSMSSSQQQQNHLNGSSNERAVIQQQQQQQPIQNYSHLYNIHQQQLQIQQQRQQYRTLSYQQSCFIKPIPFSCMVGTILATYNHFLLESSKRHEQNNMKIRGRYSSSNNNSRNYRTVIKSSSSTSTLLPESLPILRNLGRSIGIVYAYYMIQCPMEAIHKKQSYVHNGIAAFMISYIGFAQQAIITIPFIPAYTLYGVPHLARNMIGASIYGCIAMVIGAFYGNKSF